MNLFQVVLFIQVCFFYGFQSRSSIYCNYFFFHFVELSGIYWFIFHVRFFYLCHPQRSRILDHFLAFPKRTFGYLFLLFPFRNIHLFSCFFNWSFDMASRLVQLFTSRLIYLSYGLEFREGLVHRSLFFIG